jgi:hopene-associated glycosyltransferase HpnB
MRDTLDASSPDSAPTCHVIAVIPARNEAAGIRQAVTSLSQQQYPGSFRIIVVDDESTDGTSDAARSTGSERLTVLRSQPWQPGWTGKLWAVSQGVAEAARHAPEYLLLTDADIVHPPGNLARLVAHAERGTYDLVSLMVMLRCQSRAERFLIPPFLFFFFMLYPPAWIRSARHRAAGAAGGCMLIRRDRLERMGGIECIRGAVIDDCALAQAVKRDGGRVWLGTTTTAHSLREYGTFAEIEQMISRTAFTQLRHSWLLLMGTALGLTVTFVAPPAAALAGSGLGAAACLLMAVTYLPTLRLYRRSPLWAFTLPLAALFYLRATIHSALLYHSGKGGQWKGRAQDRRYTENS